MRLTMALAAAALCLGMVAPGAAANGSVPHFLMRTVQRPEVAGAPALVLAAALDPRPAEREEWGELLLRVARGGFNAVYVNVPWNVGKKGSLAVADLDAFLAKVAEAGLKAIMGPPLRTHSVSGARGWRQFSPSWRSTPRRSYGSRRATTRPRGARSSLPRRRRR